MRGKGFTALLKYAAQQKANMNLVVSKVVLDLSTDIIMRTPVDKGPLRGGWMPSIGSPLSGETGIEDKTGRVALGKVAAVAPKAPGQIFWLVNGMPYARVAEYGEWGTGPYSTVKTTRDGYSVQAPSGMVRVTITETDRKLENAVRLAQQKRL